MNSKHITALIGVPVATAAILLCFAGSASAAVPATAGEPGLIATHNLSSHLGTLVPDAANSDHVATSPNGRYAYVASATANVVTVVDLHTDKVVKTIPVGHGPVDVTFDNSGAHAYVANTLDGTVSLIDTQTMSVTKTLKVGEPSDGINSIAVNQTASGEEIYVTTELGSILRIENVTTGKTGTIKVTPYPGSVVIADGKLVVAEANANGKVDVLDLQTGKVIKQLTTPNNADVVGAAAIPGTDTVVLTGDGETSWLNLTDDSFVATVPVRSAPGNLTDVTTSPNGAYTYIAAAGYPDVSNPPDGTVTVVENADHKVVKTATVGQFPWTIAATNSSVVVPDAPASGQTYLQIIPTADLV